MSDRNFCQAFKAIVSVIPSISIRKVVVFQSVKSEG